MTVKHEVRLYLRGDIIMTVDADPEDGDAWVEALSLALGALSDADISEAVEVVGHDICGVAGDQHCDECGALVESIIGCPDGAEICQGCFDAGHH